MMNRRRPLQVGSVIKKCLVEVLCCLNLQHITISEVKMSQDLKYANVFFSPLGSRTLTTNLEEFIPKIRYRLSKLLRLRYVPQIRFELDTTFDNFSKIDSILREKNIENSEQI